MNWKEMEFLITEQQKLVIEVSLEAANFSPEQISASVQPLLDGSVDDGDEEKIAESMLQLVLDMPSYKNLMEFTVDNHEAFKKMYAFLAQSTPAELTKFLEITQLSAGKIGAAKMVDSFLQTGLATDKRSAS